MPLTRRQFNALTLSAAGLAALGPAARLLARRTESPGQLFEWKRVAGGAHVAFGQGGNALLLAAQGRSVLIDCKNPGLGATLRREAEAFGAPLRLVANTHHHRDHVGGNYAFTGDLPLLAHENAGPRIAAQVEALLAGVAATLKQVESGEKPAPKQAVDEIKAFQDSIAGVAPEAFAPTRLVKERVNSEHTGAIDVHFHHIGPGHTDNDLVVFFPVYNLVHMGDLLFHKLHPFIDRPAGAATTGWQHSLREVMALCNDRTIVVPGHGEITDKSGIQAQIDYFDRMRDIVRHAKDVESMTKEEVMKLQPGAYQDYGFTQALPRALGAIYDELAATSPAP